ncbi:phycobilisome protein [Chroococcidiopsis sp. TS-821]|uniref:phycobilisome protein n=1 Tax=Chroococcidiopsis sp. TS-821 TaxID=1378066 RepID=UPI000CEDBE88|nr:phycobilisome protein [Chroococcidiopsis sp. TS-821]PPS45913.1 phycobilisome protein [Chroococcidiopsis sp. TS-821]
MHSEIKSLLYEAEDHYLTLEEITTAKLCIASLQVRLEIYELLRDQEVTIFQPIADQLLVTFAQNQRDLEQALKRWLLVLRYCTMAMLLNNQEFLQQRLLEWLIGIVQAHRTQAIETNICQLLQNQLQEHLNAQQLALLQPFLAQAETTLLKANAVAEL